MQKKLCALLLGRGAEYLIGLKKNQPTLYAAAQRLCASQAPQSAQTQEERTRDRCTTRSVQVFCVPEAKPYTLWAGLRCIVRVERSGTRGKKPYRETTLYISSHTASAEEFARIVRGHWQVENGLHWVKDVVQGDDCCTTKAGFAPENLSLLRSLAVTLYRLHGNYSIKRALRRFAHDLPSLIRLLV